MPTSRQASHGLSLDNRRPPASRNLKRVGTPHNHKFDIADDNAVGVLLGKLLESGPHQKRRERLMEALDEAYRRYHEAGAKERQAFFHGLLTGYAVALKLW